MFHHARRTLRLPLLAAALLSAACDGPAEPVVPEAAVLRLSADSLSLVEGSVDTLSATVLDARGEPIPDAQVHWASSDTAIVRVTADGVVSARRPGMTLVTATAPRPGGAPLTASALVQVSPVLSVTFEPDSLVFASPGCAGGLFARVRTGSGEELKALFVAYSVADSSVVSLHTVVTTGTYRGHLRTVLAERVGSTQVIGTYRDASDTARVRVASDSIWRFFISRSPGWGLSPERWETAPGDTTRFYAGAQYTPCTPGTANGPAVPGVDAAFLSLDDSVATVDAGGLVTAHSRGVARIVARWRDFADTISVEVKTYRIQPADTTALVGDTVRYRAFVTDGEGRETEVRPFAIGTSSLDVAPVSFLQDGTPVAVGRQAGTATITLGILNRFRPATLRVQDRPDG